MNGRLAMKSTGGGSSEALSSAAAATVVPVILAAAETVSDAAPTDAQLLIRVCNVGMAEFIASFGYPSLVLFLGEYFVTWAHRLTCASHSYIGFYRVI